MTEKKRDYTGWWYRYSLRYLDIEIKPYLKLKIRQSWLKEVRQALNMSTRGVARKMNVRQSTYWNLEQAECNGRISLNSLRKCAEALDCELVYAIRPKCCAVFSAVIWSQLPDRRAKHSLYNPRFRRKKGWARNSDPQAASIVWLWRASERKEREIY